MKAEMGRLSIDIPKAERKVLKQWAIEHDMTLRDAVRTGIRTLISSPCPLGDPNCHIPNETTKKVMEETEKGIGLHTYNSVEEMFESLGISQC